MILRLKKVMKHNPASVRSWLLLVVLSWFLPLLVFAQEGQRLSVTPALFEMSAVPGQVWNSSIRVINPNQYPLTVYIEPVLFMPRGEGGDGTLVRSADLDETISSLAQWIDVKREPIEILPEQTQNVPFTVQIPSEAPPGGHFAAFTVSTRPPVSETDATELRTTQVVTSLFFVRVAGAVIEEASIREFSPEQRFVTSPAVTLSLRFQNDGNVHVRPQGDIVITNMWGQERGVIPINRQSHFGNVLPDSVRKFSFTWSGDLSLADIGRYEASVTLAYGADARQFVTSSTHFWVIPIIPLLVTFGILSSIILLAVWLVRWYVRRMLVASGYVPVARQPIVRTTRVIVEDLAISATPPAKSERDLVTSLPSWYRPTPSRHQLHTYLRVLIERLSLLFNERVRLVVGGLLLVALIIVLGYFISIARETERSYQVAYEGGGSPVMVSSDQIEFEARKLDIAQGEPPRMFENEPLWVAIVNKSGVAGLGATVAVLLETAGYAVGSVDTELGAAQGRTIIIYDPRVTDDALALSAKLNNAPLSAFASPDTASSLIEIHVGSDLVSGLQP